MPPTVKVGLSASLTGQFATQGRQALAGLRAWIADLNRSGGLPVADRRRTLPVALRHYDDGSRAEGTIQATRRLLEQDRVDLLFGPYSAGLTQTAAAVAAERGRLLWNQGGASDSVYRPGRRVVGILAPAGQYLAALPALVRRADPAARTFAILRCSTGAFSRQVSGGLEGQALALGFEKTRHCEFPPEAADFSDLIDRVAQQPPDLLLAVGRIRHDLALAALLAQRRRSGVFREGRPGAVAVVAAPIAQFRAALGADAAGFIGPSQWEPPEESADSPAFYPRLRPHRGGGNGLLAAGGPRRRQPAGGLPYGPGLRRRAGGPTLRGGGGNPGRAGAVASRPQAGLYHLLRPVSAGTGKRPAGGPLAAHRPVAAGAQGRPQLPGATAAAAGLPLGRPARPVTAKFWARAFRFPSPPAGEGEGTWPG